MGRHSRYFCSALKIRTESSTVQSPPAIETMPCGSRLEVFQSSGADSLAPGDGSDIAGTGLGIGARRDTEWLRRRCVRGAAVRRHLAQKSRDGKRTSLFARALAGGDIVSFDLSRLRRAGHAPGQRRPLRATAQSRDRYDVRAEHDKDETSDAVSRTRISATPRRLARPPRSSFPRVSFRCVVTAASRDRPCLLHGSCLGERKVELAEGRPFPRERGQAWRVSPPFNQTLLSWEPECSIFAHGPGHDANGTTELRNAFRWLLKQPQ